MIRYYKRHLPLVTVALLISMLTQLAVPVTALMEQQMIDLITNGNLEGFQNKLLWACSIVLATALAYLFNALLQKRFQVRFQEDLCNDLYDGVMRQSHVQFSQKDTAEQMSFVQNHSSTIANNLTQPVFTLISYGVTAIVVFGMIFYYSPLFAAVSIFCAVVTTLLPLRFNKKLSSQLMDKLDKDATVTLQLKEALNGHEVVTALGIVQKIRGRFTKVSHEKADSDYKMNVTISLLENVARVTQKVTWFISFLLAGSLAVHGDITVGTLVMFITLCAELNSSVTLYAQTLPILFSTRPDIKKMLELIDNKETEFQGKADFAFTDKIAVENLSFRYNSEVPVLDELNLTIHKNEKIVLIGASGCGKSTLIKLLSGNYANYTGRICYDNVELHELNIQKLQKQVTVIHQNTFIFNDTIRFNICLSEEFSDEALQNALQSSGVKSFLTTVPGGLDGTCGENGSKLSGGQKQRIALARALIRGVNVLILDEGVSAIDVETANEIEQELLDRKDLTLFTITHRIKDGLTEQYDRVLMMENGKLENEMAV